MSAGAHPSLAEFFEAEFAALKPDTDAPCDFYLFFKLNDHLLKWRTQGSHLDADFLARYRERGLRSVWIRQADRALFEQYVRGEIANEPPAIASAPAAEPPATPAPPKVPAAAPRNEPRTERGAEIAQALQSPALTPEQRKAVVAETAREALGELAAAKTVAEQRQANQQARDTVQDVLDAVGKQTARMAADVWKLAEVDPELEHSVNVATYTVIFALAFGRIEDDLIQDLALAGLLHDVGLSQITPRLASKPTQAHTPDERAGYAQHVESSLELLGELLPSVPERVRLMVHQHHEKFDGSGYPQKLSGFKIDDVAQLVGMANFLDTMASGHWDGRERTFRQSFETLEGLEKARTFPEYFNPDVFQVVVQWLRKSVDASVMGQAAEIVGSRTQAIVGKMDGKTGSKTAA